MAGEFVPLLNDSPDQIGIAFGDPAQCEKSGFYAGFGKQGKEPIDITLDPTWQGRPIGARY
jgi:hypothetical protein